MTPSEIKQAHIAEYNQAAAEVYDLTKRLEAKEKRMVELRVIIATADALEQGAQQESEGSDNGSV